MTSNHHEKNYWEVPRSIFIFKIKKERHLKNSASNLQTTKKLKIKNTDISRWRSHICLNGFLCRSSILVELEFEDVGFCEREENRRIWVKTLTARRETKSKLNPQTTPFVISWQDIVSTPFKVLISSRINLAYVANTGEFELQGKIQSYRNYLKFVRYASLLITTKN